MVKWTAPYELCMFSFIPYLLDLRSGKFMVELLNFPISAWRFLSTFSRYLSTKILLKCLQSLLTEYLEEFLKEFLKESACGVCLKEFLKESLKEFLKESLKESAYGVLLW